MITKENILFLILAYLIGAIPSAVWVGRMFFNTDVREYGSGNAGATNTFRVLGAKAGVPVLIMDVLKGWVAVHLFDWIKYNDLLSPEEAFEIRLAFGVAAVIGHLFPIYTGFRGGKGVATMLGFMIGIYWQAALVSAIIFLLILFISKYVSLSSILASLAFPFVVFLLPLQQIISYEPHNNSLIIFSIFVPILSLITHQKNIERLLRKEENKTKFGKKRK